MSAIQNLSSNIWSRTSGPRFRFIPTTLLPEHAGFSAKTPAVALAKWVWRGGCD